MRSVWLLVGLLQAGVAQAASLDNLEMGGPWGTPAATDATAVWWSPAGLAMGHGTRVLIEGAPTFAVINVDRSDPHGGPDQIRLQGAVPFAGVATDLGLHGLANAYFGGDLVAAQRRLRENGLARQDPAPENGAWPDYRPVTRGQDGHY